MSIRVGVAIMIARGEEIHANNKVHEAAASFYICVLLPRSIR
jgi:hypothetical protein